MTCVECGQTVPEGAAACPTCSTPVPLSASSSHSPKWLTPAWAIKRLIAASTAGLIVLLVTAAPHLIFRLGLRLPLRTSSIVREALTRAGRDARVAEMVGQPLRARWLVQGYMTHNETEWSEARGWI